MRTGTLKPEEHFICDEPYSDEVRAHQRYYYAAIAGATVSRTRAKP
jgi:hypothetical protein